MPRHSKNNSDGAHFTYAERATMATTVGSTVARLGGDSLRPYHHCCLSLAPARDPVLTPGGHLYDKPAILAALLAQRRTARAARAAAADAAAAAAAARRAAADRGAAVAAFVDAGAPVVAAAAVVAASTAGGGGAPDSGGGGGGGGSDGGVGTGKAGLGPPPSNFWMPARAPAAAPAAAAAADPRTRCPVSGAPLRAKQLITVRFTRPPEEVAAAAAAAAAATPAAAAAPPSAAGGAPAGSSAGVPVAATTVTPLPPSTAAPTSAAAAAADAAPSPRPPPDNRVAVYVCAVCADTLSNAAAPTVLVPSGAVVCGECVRRFVVKTKTDPTTGARLRVPAGVVPIKTGGTAFAASGGEAKVAARYAPAARV